MKIGVQGGKGSFSELAGLNWLKKQNQTANMSYLISSERVLNELSLGNIDYGVIAINNSRGGIVHESLTALAKYPCKIVDQLPLLVEQNLMSLPNVGLHEINEIYSHPQAFRQCRDFLFEHLWGCKLIESDDTAESARRLSEGLLPKTAAVIGRRDCADLYNLQLLKTTIQDLTCNETLFLILQKT